MKLSELLDHTRLDVLDHLDRELTVPVIDGLQAQGDLIVVPLALVPAVTLPAPPHWRMVPESGVELVRGVAGTNPHTLVADTGTCRWTPFVQDLLGLAVGAVENTAAAYLIHPEHGGTGIAPGMWLVRRQQEQGHRARVTVAD